MLIHRALRTWDVLTTRDLVHEINAITADELRFGDRTHSGRTIRPVRELAREAGAWATRRSSQLKHMLREMAQARRGPVSGGTMCVCRAAQGCRAKPPRLVRPSSRRSTAAEIHDHLVGAGWVEIPRG